MTVEAGATVKHATHCVELVAWLSVLVTTRLRDPGVALSVSRVNFRVCRSTSSDFVTVGQTAGLLQGEKLRLAPRAKPVPTTVTTAAFWPARGCSA